MKAVIMAGGEGSRLRPLTCGRPKPMVPVLNRPVMAHIIDLLKEHGIRNIAATLQYQPEAIRDYFGDGTPYGVNLNYFVEETPLGTAGSVKNASGFLDETFLVISGDALTDLDLSKAIEFHKRNNAMATLVLTKVSCPLEYGVVITGDDGRINRFLEKPGWGEVFSDTVNTGIYVLEPEVLEFFAPGRKFDFSKDLFPLLLREKRPLFGVVLPGYWCDIGNLEQYLQAHYEALAGRVKVNLPGCETSPGVWLEDGADVSVEASIRGPVLIGGNCQVRAGARIEPFSVLGRGCLVQEGASLKRSVVWNNVFIGRNAALRGAVIGSRVQVQAGASVFEGAVVGDDSIIRENSQLKPEVKLWPHKLVEAGATANRSLVWGTRSPKKMFGFEGIAGTVNVDLTPEAALLAGAAFGSIYGAGASIAVSGDGHQTARLVRESVILGLQSTGVNVLDAGDAVMPLHRYIVRLHGARAGIHVKVSLHEPGRVIMVFTNERGGNISRDLERKVESTLAREDFTRAAADRLGLRQHISGAAGAYLEDITSGLTDLMKVKPGGTRGGKLILACERANSGLAEGLAAKLGLGVINYLSEADGSVSWPDLVKMIPAIARSVIEEGADLGVIMDTGFEKMILVDDNGRVIADDMLTVLLALIVLKEKSGPVVVPVTAPRAVEILAERYGGKVVRTKTTLQDFHNQVLALGQAAGDIPRYLLHLDALAALARVAAFVTRNNIKLSDLADEIPDFFVNRRSVPVSWEAKGTVIRSLIQEAREREHELLDGVKVFHQDGWALVLPDPDEPVCRVFSEGSSMEIAESLTDFYLKRIKEIAGISGAEMEENVLAEKIN